MDIERRRMGEDQQNKHIMEGVGLKFMMISTATLLTSNTVIV